jgi:hypothetical protein
LKAKTIVLLLKSQNCCVTFESQNDCVTSIESKNYCVTFESQKLLFGFECQNYCSVLNAKTDQFREQCTWKNTTQQNFGKQIDIILSYKVVDENGNFDHWPSSIFLVVVTLMLHIGSISLLVVL